MQLSLHLKTPTASHTRDLIALLTAKGWQTRRQIGEALNWNEWFIRLVAASDETRIIRGQSGFNVIEKCTAEEIQYAANQRVSQGKREIRTGMSWLKQLAKRK